MLELVEVEVEFKRTAHLFAATALTLALTVAVVDLLARDESMVLGGAVTCYRT